MGSAKNACGEAQLFCSLSLPLKEGTYEKIPKPPFHLLCSPVTVKQLQSGYVMWLLVLQQAIWKWGSSVLL